MLMVEAAGLTRERRACLLRFREMLHLEQGDCYVSQELRLHGRAVVCAHIREVLLELFVKRNIDHQLPHRRRIRTVLVYVDVHVEGTALRQAQLVDNSVGHSVFE